jgi:hypothetical protein
VAKRSSAKRKGSGRARTRATRATAKTSKKPARSAASRATGKAAGRRKPTPARRPGSAKAARRKTAARSAASRSARRKPAAKPSALQSAATRLRGAAATAVVAIRARLPWGPDENDPILLLEADHRRFEDLLKQGEETTERAVKARTQLLDTLTSELNIHELIEEKVLYPALEPHPEARAIVLEGYQEHHVADLIVKELHEVARDDEQWGAKFKVLKESLEHHIEEEEGEMFRTARAVLSREELDELGARMRALRAEHEQ